MFRRYYLFCISSDKLVIRISDIVSIFPIRIGTVTTTTNSSLYKVGIRYNNNRTVYILKSLFKYFIIKDVIRLRSYLFDKHYSYHEIMDEIRVNMSNLNIR